MASPAQERARAALAAFVARHGRRPNKGESIYGGRTTAAKPAQGPQAPPRKKRRKKPDALTTAWRWVKKNPVKTALGAAAVTVAAIPASRRVVVDNAVMAANLLRGGK